MTLKYKYYCFTFNTSTKAFKPLLNILNKYTKLL